MAGIIFWDVDTQVDFIDPRGKLYIKGAEQILPELERLTAYSREHGLKRIGSVDYHHVDDAEISDDPDYVSTFPPHCLRDTPGQKKVDDTTPHDPWWVESVPWPADEVVEKAHHHDGEIIFRKNALDVFTNPNVDVVLEALTPQVAVVYGVATDFCVRLTVEGLLERGLRVIVVTDAVQPIDSARGVALFREWEQRGVGLVTTDAVVDEGLLGATPGQPIC